MGHEVFFLAVGDGQRGGDAILVRYGDLFGSREDQTCVVIDGGTKETGKKIVELVKDHFKTDYVDLVINTHPDGDHASGLTEVLEHVGVNQLWMHLSWDHSLDVKSMFHDGRVTDNSVRESLKRSLQNAKDLETLAKEKGIPIHEPFSNGEIGDDFPEITILGPSREYYESLLPQFRGTPEPKGLVQRTVRTIKDAIEWITESWSKETLTEPDENATSAENNSSVITLMSLDDKLFLFTGDAGVPALDKAADKAEELGIDPKDIQFLQVPHHGSRKNVGPVILNRLIGGIFEAAPESYEKRAYVSAPKEGDPKHPSRKVINAFMRRGVEVVGTQGSSLRRHQNAPEHKNWNSPVTPIAFNSTVEE